MRGGKTCPKLTTSTSGGIGLALVRQLARLMDGTVEYLPDQGWYSFVLSLPAVDPASPAAEPGASQAVAAG
ncbi:MAG: hypothetical protein ACE5F5_02285 [Acidimicrobiia bacterium]